MQFSGSHHFFFSLSNCEAMSEFKKKKKKLFAAVPKLLKQVWQATIQELDERRHVYEKLFKHRNVTSCCLSLHTFHKVFLVSPLQLFGCKPKAFYFSSILTILACFDVITLFVIKCFTLDSFFLIA